jgi:hypothetical protein
MWKLYILFDPYRNGHFLDRRALVGKPGRPARPVAQAKRQPRAGGFRVSVQQGMLAFCKLPLGGNMPAIVTKPETPLERMQDD